MAIIGEGLFHMLFQARGTYESITIYAWCLVVGELKGKRKMCFIAHRAAKKQRR